MSWLLFQSILNSPFIFDYASFLFIANDPAHKHEPLNYIEYNKSFPFPWSIVIFLSYFASNNVLSQTHSEGPVLPLFHHQFYFLSTFPNKTTVFTNNVSYHKLNIFPSSSMSLLTH